MDVDRQTANLPEEKISQGRSFSSNYRCCSQSRKISIGVFVDSISKEETKNKKDAVLQIAENRTCAKENRVQDHQGHTPLVDKRATVEQQETSPWVSTRSFNPKISSSIAAHYTEHTPSFPVASRAYPSSKLLEKASAAHSLKFFTVQSGLKSDECREINFGKATNSGEARKINDAGHENHAFSTEPGVLLEKEQREDKERETETGGCETLRMKLWEVLGNVSSSNRCCPIYQSVELHPDQERVKKQSPIENVNPNSDTIESDSEKHTFKRPKTRSFTRKKACPKNQHNKIEVRKSTSNRNDSFRRDLSGRLYDNFNDGSLPSKRNKIVKASSGLETDQGHDYEKAEERQQPGNKSRTVPAFEKSGMHRNQVLSPNTSNERRNNVFIEPKSGTKTNSSFDFLLNVITEQQKDVELPKSRLVDGSFPSKRKKIVIDRSEAEARQGETRQGHNCETAEEGQQYENKSRSISSNEKSMMHRDDVIGANCCERRNDVLVEPRSGSKKNNSKDSQLRMRNEQQKDVEQPMEDSKKDKKEEITDSLLKNIRNSVHDPPTPHFEIRSHSCLQKIKQGKLPSQRPAEKLFTTKGIRSFKNLLCSTSVECKSNVQVESSDGRPEMNKGLLVKTSVIVEEDNDSGMSKISTDATDSESSEDDSQMKGCRKPEHPLPEISVPEKFLCGPDKSLSNGKDVTSTGYSPVSKSFKETQVSSDLQMYLEQNHGDVLASAVALLALALDRLKKKVKLITSKRSAEIMRATGEEIFLLLQNAESCIKTDVGKLKNLNQLKRKRLETRLQEQQEQLLGIYSKFKEEFDKHLQDYDGVIDDLEKHEIELKRYVERQRAAHKKVLSQVEQGITVQLDDAESRVIAIQELAKQKMLQLKLVLAASLKQGAFG